MIRRVLRPGQSGDRQGVGASPRLRSDHRYRGYRAVTFMTVTTRSFLGLISGFYVLLRLC